MAFNQARLPYLIKLPKKKKAQPKNWRCARYEELTVSAS
jgi:hypothetical protein